MDEEHNAKLPLHEVVLAALKTLAEIASDPKARASDRIKARNHLKRRLKQVRQLTRDQTLAVEFMEEVEELIGGRAE
jgi:hypothetical protein